MNVSQFYFVLSAIYISHTLPKDMNVMFAIACLIAGVFFAFLGD